MREIANRFATREVDQVNDVPLGCHGDGFAVRREGEPFIPAVQIGALQLDLAKLLSGGGGADAQTEVLLGYDRPPVGGNRGGFNGSSFPASKGIEHAARD